MFADYFYSAGLYTLCSFPSNVKPYFTCPEYSSLRDNFFVKCLLLHAERYFHFYMDCLFLYFLALQSSAGYGLLWLCSPARAMASCGSAAQRGLWPPVALQPSAGYGLLVHDAPQSVGFLWTSDQLVAETST
jgi:hypothetical protein